MYIASQEAIDCALLSRAHVQGGNRSCRYRRCREHKNCHISRPRHLSDLLAQRISRIWRKTGFSMLRIEGHNPRASQIVPFC